jgi:aminoglycoside phosphotransferase (APT) family kinase protein
MLTKKGPVILDWMTAFRGAPAADIARTSVLFRFAQMPYVGFFTRTAISLARRRFHRLYLSRYLQLDSDVSEDMIRLWSVPIAAARLEENIPEETDLIISFLRQSLIKIAKDA